MPLLADGIGMPVILDFPNNNYGNSSNNNRSKQVDRPMLVVSLTSAGGGTKSPHPSASTSQSHTVSMALKAPPPSTRCTAFLRYAIQDSQLWRLFLLCLFLRHFLSIYLSCFGGGPLSGHHCTRSPTPPPILQHCCSVAPPPGVCVSSVNVCL